MMSINLSFISKYRSAFMGLAIFWIFFYHTGVDIPVLREIFALGWMGVDIFFFVSGFGLCASLTKNSSIREFFKRRFFRIIPTWWLVLTLMAILGTILSLKGFPKTSADFFYWFTGLGWWTGNCNFEWYIPTLIVFYLISPILSRLSLKTLCISVLVVMIAAVFTEVVNLNLLGGLYMSYSRAPIYIFGFAVYKYWQSKESLSVNVWLPMGIIGLLFFGVGLYIKNIDITLGLTVARVAIPLFIIPMLALVALVFYKIKYINTLLAALGTISMEVYLLHINHEFAESVKTTALTHVNGYLVKMTWFMMIVAGAWLLHIVVKHTTELISTQNDKNKLK